MNNRLQRARLSFAKRLRVVFVYREGSPWISASNLREHYPAWDSIDIHDIGINAFPPNMFPIDLDRALTQHPAMRPYLR